jgi:ribosomal protein S18 acetylase RimI-like enzyme
MSTSVRLLEELAANAWPPVVTQVVDGWLLRYAFGVSRRANSVLALATTGEAALEDRVAKVEAFYTRRGLPARFHISPAAPEGLDAWLEARGYRRDCPTAVQTAPLAEVLERSRALSFEITLAPAPDDAWFSVYNATHHRDEQDRQVRVSIMTRIGPPSVFALLRVEGEPAAVGQGVTERGWLGLFSMATHPRFQRRGAATALVYALAEWGRSLGAESAYLQVMDATPIAAACYRKLGFRTCYGYHYREAPSARPEEVAAEGK